MGMTKIWERLYLGSLRDAAQLAAENPFGITLSFLSAPTKCLTGQAGSGIRVSPLPTLAQSRHGNSMPSWERYRKAFDTEVC